jgi:hypothetical protein
MLVPAFWACCRPRLRAPSLAEDGASKSISHARLTLRRIGLTNGQGGEVWRMPEVNKTDNLGGNEKIWLG